MAISGHKSLQSLALYTRVCDGEKMIIGLKLTFSLLKPEEAKKLQESKDEDSDQASEGPDETGEPAPKKMRAILPKPNADGT